jgi:hypothetical protein
LSHARWAYPQADFEIVAGFADNSHYALRITPIAHNTEYEWIGRQVNRSTINLQNLVTTMAKTDQQQQLSNMDLAPSQTINASRRRNRGKPKVEDSGETTQTTASSSKKDSAVESSGKPDATASASASVKPAAKKNRSQKKKKAKAPNETANAQEKGAEGKPNGDEQQSKKKQPAKSNNNKGRNKRNNARKRYPWRKHLPADSVDPITLETLDSLTYPPFAMYASAPHLPIPEWPIPEIAAETSSSEPAPAAAETEEDRQRRIISEQWGHKLTENENVVVEEEELVAPSKRHYHLYDGRALAYYMVSQLQFIDPLNRRDLTRDELVNLDRYLRRHNFTDINVTEAYDTKGVTFSSAGATANTAAGRVAILQQLAGNLLNGLFGRTSVSSQQPSSSQSSRPAGAAAAAAPASTNRLMMQYQAHEQSQEQSSNRRRNNNTYTSQDETGGTDFPEDLGIYGDAGGVLVIDDDLHPGLRSNAVEFRPAAPAGTDATESSGSNLFWSASHIAARYGHAAMVQQENFPSLARSPPAESQPKLELLVAKKPAPSVKTLSRITKTVRKTDPDEVNRQWEAREDSRRKAALSKLTFGSNQAAWETSVMQDIPSSLPPTTTSDGVPTEAQLERNRAFAQALGVAPATLRANLNAGWARPTQTTVELDDFGHELNATLYPDSLVMWVRENMGPVLKLERKWKAFLGDDTAQSLSMNHMDKPLRKRVHEYSDFWKLQTESFDPEPKRYIYCAKLRDTCAPYPLLSDAARNWRGPRPVLQSTSSLPSDQQTVGQSAQGRELASGPDRVPLSLKPRSQTIDSEPTESLPGMAISGARTLTMTEPDAALNSRFGALAVGRERSKLELQKRTLPLELPAYDQPKGFDFSEEVQLQKERVELRARKEREVESRKQRALEAAFASSDEEGGGGRYGAGDDDSEWSEDEQVALYAGEDEDE